MSIFGHQGDVSFFPVRDKSKLKLKKKLKVEKNGGITVVKGEQTYHHHQFREPELVDIYPIDAQLAEGLQHHYVHVKKTTTMQHYNIKEGRLTGEHTSITFPPGDYIIGNQREMTKGREIKQVID